MRRARGAPGARPEWVSVIRRSVLAGARERVALDVDDVHDEANRLEHVISEELEAKIDRALGYPTHDPHGDPIPDRHLRWPQPAASAARSDRRQKRSPTRPTR